MFELRADSYRTLVFACNLAAGFLIWGSTSEAKEPKELRFDYPPVMPALVFGITRGEMQLRAYLQLEDFELSTPKTRVLFVGGFGGDASNVREENMVVANLLHCWRTKYSNGPLGEKFLLSAVPEMNPAATPGRVGNNSGGNPATGYPPKERAYDSPTNPEAIYLWRWLGMYAPDLVIEVRLGDKLIWEVPDTDDPQLQALAKLLDAKPLKGESEFVSALVKHPPCETGTIPALRLQVDQKEAEEWIPDFVASLDESKFKGPSPARAELQRRVKRTPLEVATELSSIYGQDLNSVQYIPAVALIARVRLGQLTGDEKQLADVERIVAPYYSGEKQIEIKNGSDISGHLIFTELARVTEGERRKRYLELAKAAADLAFDTDGKPREAMPFHSEMSDALFMGGPILAQVGELTGEQRYFEACWRHLHFMRNLVRRSDGLYSHSPLGAHAWGRGNGFPALGLAMCIPYFPRSGSDYSELLIAQRRHLEKLVELQDPTGCWHQVIDHPESYRELTATAMIGYALSQAANEERYQNPAREKKLFQQAADKAWHAVNSRIGRDGHLVDVCTGTGKFPKLRDYYDRPAILGKDARGGAMALLFAVEMAEREAWKKESEPK
jgi:unsaturated rhamnogalacturonyl hydrolase